MNLYSRIVHKKREYFFIDLKKLNGVSENSIKKIPFIRRFFIENHVRTLLKRGESTEDINLCDFKRGDVVYAEPDRIVMQDFSGLPVLLDLLMIKKRIEQANENTVFPDIKIPVDLVVDHSHEVVHWGCREAVQKNMKYEFKNNRSRFLFLKMAEKSFENVRVFYSGRGIIHQINIEHLSKLVNTERKGDAVYMHPEMVWGTDSHSTMINGAGIMGWGTGGIEALAATMGRAPSADMPMIVGVHLKNRLKQGVNHYDLALFITCKLRSLGIKGFSAEFFGEGVKHIPVQGRCTIANMAPEYGAGSGFFPPDEESLRFLKLTGRVQERDLYRAYLKKAGLFQDYINEPEYDRVVEIDLSEVSVNIAGPSNPFEKRELRISDDCKVPDTEKRDKELVIASITSCTSTANPFLIVQAGLFLRNCLKAGLSSSEKVKKTFTPGSFTVRKYLEKMDLLKYFEDAGFFITGYGCGTCLGNSGELSEQGKEVKEPYALISGNRNFRGRIHKNLSGCFLGSPWLVAAGAFKGSISYNFLNDNIGYDKTGRPVKPFEMLPSDEEVTSYVREFITEEIFTDNTGCVPISNKQENLQGEFLFEEHKSYFKIPPFLDKGCCPEEPAGAEEYPVLLRLGDNITTDHISPVCRILPDSDAGRYLVSAGCGSEELNSYGTRRGNHEVMKRGAFTNSSLNNTMGGINLGSKTVTYPKREIMTVFSASEVYSGRCPGLVIIAGRNYGMGSARDWAAKAVRLLGVRCIIAESFERIHRRNLIHMGVWPLVITREQRDTVRRADDIEKVKMNLKDFFKSGGSVKITLYSGKGDFSLRVRPDVRSEFEFLCLKDGGIMPHLYRGSLNIH